MSSIMMCKMEGTSFVLCTGIVAPNKTKHEQYEEELWWYSTSSILLVRPAHRHLPVWVELHGLSFAFVINRVESHHRLEERMKRKVGLRIHGNLKQWREDVVDHVREHANLPVDARVCLYIMYIRYRFYFRIPTATRLSKAVTCILSFDPQAHLGDEYKEASR